MNQYDKLASFIIENVGGKNNIESVTHCMTRLRFKLKNIEQADRKAMNSNKDIVSTQIAEGKLQVIIGTQVGEVYEEIIRQTGNLTEKAISEPQEKKSFLNRFAAAITQIVVPSLGVLCACGIIGGLNSVLIAAHVITTESGAYILLNAMANACLTFFPIILGYTSAKAFGMDPFIGMILGAVLVFPNISQGMNSGELITSIFGGTPLEMPVYKSFFGIPIIFPSNGYTSTVIPIMLINFLASRIERFLKLHLPNVAKQFLVPFCTILLAGILGVLAIGPISMVLQNALAAGMNWLITKSAVLAYAIEAIIYQPLVIFGLHWPLITLGLIEFANTSATLIISVIFPASFTHMALCLAVFLRTRSTKMKNIAFPAFLSACFCIIEPSIYGVALPVKKRFLYCMAGGLVGALIMVIIQSPMYAISMGVTGFMSFVNPKTGSFSGVLWSVIACLAAMATTFALAWITYKSEEDEKNEEEDVYTATVQNTIHKKEIIHAPMKGSIKDLSEMNDPAFSSMGKGVCIIPEEGKVIAPCDGILSSLFPTGHALGITSSQGAQVLIHIGKGTYNLPEQFFTRLKKQGDPIQIGETLITFDLSQLNDPRTAVVISNTNDYLDVIPLGKEHVNYGDALLSTVISKISQADNLVLE